MLERQARGDVIAAARSLNQRQCHPKLPRRLRVQRFQTRLRPLRRRAAAISHLFQIMKQLLARFHRAEALPHQT